VLFLADIFSEKEKKHQKRLFRQEVKLHRLAAQSSTCVSILHYTETPTHFLMQIEYSEGVSIRKFISLHPTLSLPSRFQLLQNVLEAYSNLHGLGILHGDIHASNILIDNDLSVKLIDFGMAYHNTYTPGEIVSKGGVLEYLAPEKLTKNVFHIARTRSDFRSEVYQIGLIAYLIFFDTLPFDAPTWKALAVKITTETPVFSEKITQNLPDWLLHLIKRALSKHPEQRFSSAIEMQENVGLV
jgi:eukaryotic-like serine/threonine-protein kinase